MDLNQVKSLFTATDFERGMEYYRKGRVTDMQCTKAGPETNVSCTVRGSKRYTVRFTEMAEGRLRISCTCPRHEDVGHEAVFIHPDHAEYDAHDRDQRPEENPEAHPCHAADHAQETILAECLEQVGRVRLLPSLIRVQEDHRKAHVDGPGDGEADRENAREADARKPAEQRAQQRDPPQAERPLHQRGKRFLIDRVYHRKLLHSVFSLSQL